MLVRVIFVIIVWRVVAAIPVFAMKARSGLNKVVYIDFCTAGRFFLKLLNVTIEPSMFNVVIMHVYVFQKG